MYSAEERDFYLEKIVEILKKQKAVNAIILVGSLGNNAADKYSDIDMSVIVEDGKIAETYKFFKKYIPDFNTFEFFEMKYSEDSLLYGIFTNTALEIDIGFNSQNSFKIANQKHIKNGLKILYLKQGFKFEKAKKRN